jgi:hypothetical protein
MIMMRINNVMFLAFTPLYFGANIIVMNEEQR